LSAEPHKKRKDAAAEEFLTKPQLRRSIQNEHLSFDPTLSKSMDLKEIRTLVDLMKKNGIAVFKLQRDNFKITLKTNEAGQPVLVSSSHSAAPVAQHPSASPASAAPSSEAAAAKPAGDKEIKSPMVGTFYCRTRRRARSPVCQSGFDTVTVGHTVVCIVEAMKVMNEVKAEKAGVVTEIRGRRRHAGPSSSHDFVPPQITEKSSSPTAAKSPCASFAPAANSAFKTVAVYSEADANSMHVQLADEAICIGGGQPPTAICASTASSAPPRSPDVDAIHPGYGFLSENAHFAGCLRKLQHQVHRPSIQADRTMMGDKGHQPRTPRKARCPGRPPAPMAPFETEQEASRDVARNRFPGDDQSRRRGRRTRHARSSPTTTFLSKASRRPQRSREGLRQRRLLHRETH
jgi:acetyl-CoA carboxylase biotin carboxyl carrier protein